MNKKEIVEFADKLTSEAYHFPRWQDFPTVDLYMDQVIELVNNYLSEFMSFSENISITPAMINNYVKSKIIPSPVKKRYSRVHIAYIIMVCVLKQTFSFAVIQKIIHADDSEENIIKLYDTFAQIQEIAMKNSIDNIKNAIVNDNEEFIMSILSSVNIYKNLAERIVYENSKPKVIKHTDE